MCRSSVDFGTSTIKHYMSLRRKPLVNFETHRRAALYTGQKDSSINRALLERESDMPKLRKRSGKRRGVSSSSTAASRKVRIVKGRVRLRVAGYNLTQSISPSHLIRHIPAVKVRLAAQRYLALHKKGVGHRRRRGGKRRKSIKRRRKNRKRR